MALRLLYKVNALGKNLNSPKFYRTSSVFYKIVQFNLSDIGEGIREVTVRDWFVKVGDKVSQFDNICLVESDKASVSITSRYDGTVKKLYYDIGDVAQVGNPLVDIDVIGDETSSQNKVPDDESKKELGKTEERYPVIEKKSSVKQDLTFNDVSNLSLEEELAAKALATPAVRRIAKENNISLNTVKASGKGGRVLKEDILRHLDGNNKSPEQVPGSILDKKVEITGVMKVMVKTMTKSNSIPTFGYSDEVNLTNLVNLRNEVKKYAALKGTNITFMPFFIKALSKALEEYPQINASVDENCEYITYKSQHNIGVAMDTDSGLLVPNIKNVQTLSILEIGKQLNKLLEDGRAKRLSPADMTGGTITISNIGIIGGTYLRPLILPPEACILALGKTKLTPVFNERGEIEKCHLLTATWAADHRVIDGATLAKLSNVWKMYLENPNYLLMNL